jgi:hypothetical protein
MAMNQYTAYETRSDGSNNNGGGFVWVSARTAALKWIASGSGTNEYYVELLAGGDPSISACNEVYLGGKHNLAVEGSMGSLAASEWDYGDNDTLGYSTIYVRLADGTDPDTKPIDYIGYGYGGGVDYSQQAAAEFTDNNSTTDVTGDVITVGAGTLPANCAGSVINVTAVTGGTIGWYWILSRDSDTTCTVDRVIGSSATAMTWYLGGARAVPTDAFREQYVAGNRQYTKNVGTITFTETVDTAKDGTSTVNIIEEGYNMTRGDRPTGTDKPLYSCGAYGFKRDNFHQFRHGRVTGTGASFCRIDLSSRFTNVSVNCSSGTANRPALYVGSVRNTIFNCEGQSINGYGIYTVAQANNSIVNCNVHDSAIGIRGGVEANITGCIVDTCTTAGILLHSSASPCFIKHNTIYNCAIGIDLKTADPQYGVQIINNIIDSCTTGVDSDQGSECWVLQGNNYYNNTTDVVIVNKGEDATAIDPQFADAANGDFAPGNSALERAELMAGGLTTSCYYPGAVQAPGGGGETSYVSIS